MLRSYYSQNKISYLEWISNNKFVTCDADEGQITFWNIDEGNFVASFKAHDLRITSLSIDPSVTYLATSSFDTTVKIWKPEQDTPHKVFTEHKSKVNCIAWMQ